MLNRALWITALAFGLGSVIGCGSKDGTADDAAEQQEAVSVVAAPIVVDDVEERIEATAPLQPYHLAVLAAEVAGRVERKLAELGQPVRQGEPLLEIDRETYRLTLQQAEAQVESAKAAFEKAKNDFARNQRLHESGDISDFRLESARVQMAAAEAAYKSAIAARDIARKQFEKTLLRAPFTGRVAAFLTDIGTTVSPGMPLVRLVDIRRLKLKVGVSERDVPRLQKGTHCSVRVDAYPGIEFDGRVTAVGPEAEAPSRTFPVEIVLENNEKYPLRAGMVAHVKILLQRFEQVPLVPLSALVDRNDRTFIYTVDGETAKEHEVKTGPQRDQMVALLSPKPLSGLVVVLGQDRLHDGDRIRVVRQERSSDTQASNSR